MAVHGRVGFQGLTLNSDTKRRVVLRSSKDALLFEFQRSVGSALGCLHDPCLGVNSGLINPGISAGILVVNSNYTQASSGRLNIEIGGLTAGSAFDRLDVSNTAALNGTLDLSLINGFTPSLGDTFEILRYGSRSGDFQTVDGLDIGGGLRFEPSFTSNSLVLTVVASP